MRLLLALASLVTIGLSGCSYVDEIPQFDDQGTVASHAASVHEAPGRLVAIGDVHGDLDATRQVLRLVGAIDEHDTWVGGSLTIVQLGDQIDRGPDDKQVLDFLAALREKADAAGGALILLNGNHELMNVAGDFRYVHEDSWSPFDEFASPVEGGDTGSDLGELSAEQHGRAHAFRPGGIYAQILAQRDVIAIVNDTLFVHGGVLPEIVDYGIDRLNAETKAWMRGETSRPLVNRGSESPVWSRHYSNDTSGSDCELLEVVLDRLDLRRMVVAHTVQDDGVSSACSERVWRIDVGMSAHYGGPIQALEILDDGVRVLK